MKCNFCFDTLLSHDKPPACVEACPMEALSFGYRDELLRVARKRIENAPGTYQPDIYGEYEAGGTSWLYISPAPFDQAGFDPGVPRQPILHYVKDFLAVVPMVLTIWPGLFAGIYLMLSGAFAQAEWFVDAEKYHVSAHGQLSCQDCHAGIAEQPRHPDPSAVGKQLTDFFDPERCTDCHDNVPEELGRNRHGAQEINPAESYENCLACHDPHRGRTQLLRDAASVDASCLQCHPK